MLARQLEELQKSCADWPADVALPQFRELRDRLAALPDSIPAVGLGLQALKDTALPPWKDRAPETLEFLQNGGAAADRAQLRERLMALPLPAAEWPVDEDRLARALLAARLLRGLGETDRAVELLWASARAVRLRREWTLLAFWLLDVAGQWLDRVSEPLRSKVSAELGAMMEQAGNIDSGIKRISASAADLDDFAGQAPDPAALLEDVRQLKYEAAVRHVRNRTKERELAIQELERLRSAAEPCSAFWFHASLELIFAAASPELLAANTVQAERLLRQLASTQMPGPIRADIEAHAHRVLGYVHRYGNNRFMHTRAREHYERALRHFKDHHDWPNLAGTLDALGRICAQLGDYAAAAQAIDESIEIKQDLKDFWGLGASFNARADSLLRQGQPLGAVPWFDANIALIRQIPRAPRHLVPKNLVEKAFAFMAAYQNSLAAQSGGTASADLARAQGCLDECEELVRGRPELAVSRAFLHVQRAALARLQARQASDRPAQLQLLEQGKEAARKSAEEFQANDRRALPNAEIQLAGLLIDHARLLDDPASAATRQDLLHQARQKLEDADRDTWDSFERAYLDLEWAAYYREMRQPAEAENHVASARHHATVCGNQSIKTRAETSMAVHLRGPTGQDRWEVVLPPGEKLNLPIFARDWRDRPLPEYELQAYVAAGPGLIQLSSGIENGTSRADPSGAGPTSCTARTDSRGQAIFTVEAPPDTPSGKVVLEVRDHNVLREARVEIHVQPFAIKSRLPDERSLTPEDQVVLRHMFGPRFREVLIRKEFGGLGGARVLLVQPFLNLPAGLNPHSPAAAGRLQAQRCLVKIGDRPFIAEEAACYEKHVRDLLAPNVSRISCWTVWGNRAGIRMSLAGDQDWDRAQDETDWLLKAAPMDTHHLMIDMFARDLGTCWYSNGSAQAGPMRLAEIYGRQLPALLTVRESGPADGLRRAEPRELTRTGITDGLRPPGDPHSLKKGNRVYLGELEIVGWRPLDGDGADWEYKLACPQDGLRVAFLSQVPPEYIDPDGVPDNLLGRRFHVVSVVEQLGLDRLLDTLKECVACYRPGTDGETVELTGAGLHLRFRTRAREWLLPNPLLQLHELLDARLARHQRSIIHGDLHGRNVIVSPRGMPYYIDFSETTIGPTLFDFVKHEISLWDWNLASPPREAAKCTLGEALELMEVLTCRDNRFPASFALPRSLELKRERDETSWLATFYQCVCTLRSLAKQHSSLSDEAPDYFRPLCVYAGFLLRWCSPRAHERMKGAVAADEKADLARRGVFLTALSAMLMSRGLVGAQPRDPSA